MFLIFVLSLPLGACRDNSSNNSNNSDNTDSYVNMVQNKDNDAFFIVLNSAPAAGEECSCYIKAGSPTELLDSAVRNFNTNDLSYFYKNYGLGQFRYYAQNGVETLYFNGKELNCAESSSPGDCSVWFSHTKTRFSSPIVKSFYHAGENECNVEFVCVDIYNEVNDGKGYDEWREWLSQYSFTTLKFADKERNCLIQTMHDETIIVFEENNRLMFTQSLTEFLTEDNIARLSVVNIKADSGINPELPLYTKYKEDTASEYIYDFKKVLENDNIGLYSKLSQTVERGTYIPWFGNKEAGYSIGSWIPYYIDHNDGHYYYNVCYLDDVTDFHVSCFLAMFSFSDYPNDDFLFNVYYTEDNADEFLKDALAHKDVTDGVVEIDGKDRKYWTYLIREYLDSDEVLTDVYNAFIEYDDVVIRLISRRRQIDSNLLSEFSFRKIEI